MIEPEKTDEMREHILYIGNSRNAFRISVGKSEGK
jgi:hypothetical protein